MNGRGNYQYFVALNIITEITSAKDVPDVNMAWTAGTAATATTAATAATATTADKRTNERMYEGTNVRMNNFGSRSSLLWPARATRSPLSGDGSKPFDRGGH